MSEDFELLTAKGVRFIIVNLSRATLQEAIIFRNMIEEEINSGHTKLVIDLSKCDYIDSTFFGATIVASRMLIHIGSKLKVVKPAIAGEFTITYTNHSKVFDKYKTREDAIKSFEEDIQPES